MADPVVSYYKSDDTTVLDSTSNPEAFTLNGSGLIIGQTSDPNVIHIWNDKGGAAGSTPMYNTKVKIVTATGADNGDTLPNGEELVTNQWIQGKSITNSDANYTLLGNGATLSLGTINSNTFHSI
ncbi:MAG: hypothetical protein K8E24_012970, partial [Methanobacterium paludis]|nr:hypothetical protein [Methanobacterium paludis]